ncbi:MAG: fatty acid CoA ligase family protein [Myxococcota bacterium]
MNVASFVLERARRAPEAAAIHTPAGRGSGGRVRYASTTNGELDQLSDRIARGLESVGIGRGVRTALLVKPSVEMFALTLALFKTGAVPVLVDPGIGIRRLKRCLDEAEPEAFIAIPQAQMARLALGWGRASVRIAVTVGPRWARNLGDVTLDELIARGGGDEPYAVAETDDDEIAAILFTSGSTGPPKGVMYRHGNFAAQVEAIRGLAAIEPGEVDVPTFPLFALFDPALGMSSVVPDMDATRPGDVDPRVILDAAEAFGATNLFGSPALLDTVGRYGDVHGSKLSTLRRVVSAGAPVPAEVMARFLRMLPDGATIFTPYGATECLPVSCISSREVLTDTAARTEQGAGICVGAPVPSIELRIIRIDDRPIAAWDLAVVLPPGEIGEIIVRGPQATSGYYGRPEADAIAKLPASDGGGSWHRMGDVGYLDAHGRLWYCGRKADRVPTAAGTLHTAPVEAIFDAHPKVRRTALVGVPRASGGEDREPVLCVELLSGTPRRERDAIERELRAIAETHEGTRAVATFFFHRRFPVDIRHNAKIGRPELARWAARKLGRRRPVSP